MQWWYFPRSSLNKLAYAAIKKWNENEISNKSMQYCEKKDLNVDLNEVTFKQEKLCISNKVLVKWCLYILVYLLIYPSIDFVAL